MYPLGRWLTMRYHDARYLVYLTTAFLLIQSLRNPLLRSRGHPPLDMNDRPQIRQATPFLRIQGYYSKSIGREYILHAPAVWFVPSFVF